MTGQQTKRDRIYRGELFALVAACALLVPAISSAAAPPVSAPVAPIPPPLFNPEQFPSNPDYLALALIGNSSIPGVGSLSSVALLVAGEHAKIWNLEGVMTNRYTRWSLGAGTLVGGGFGVTTSPLGQIATLKYGQSLDCWALIDTDRFRRLPAEWLGIVRDGPRVAAGGD